ncbi:DNA-directed RNA polymerases IV and V subunit 2-like isoform X3 [Gastrolobium bilobum]|uniref:DNA-directed RNA polymerases IV and V subunit 2-like isoform X3 n=1 Tax=Gastrolobium bilobum TaxID=150636 RepID=UPI002AB201FE|nr:DNA-directed RNA polymerases IV and V subunit 2-like isoform X3 [Gastrolobium bilobum]
MGHIGSSKLDINDDVNDMDLDLDLDDEFPCNASILEDLGEDFVKHFCKKASMLFFDEYGLISHQINSYNHFISTGLQNTVDSFGEYIVTPGFDPSKKGDLEHFRYASIKFGKVTLDKPKFWGGEGNASVFNMLPKHARLQRMSYASRMKVNVQVQVRRKLNVLSDKFKTGKEEYLDREILKEDDREIIIGSLPVMVKSDLCWLKGDEKGDCEFDHGGYFLIKGAEKIFVAQEQIYLKRLWVLNTPCWTIMYKSQVKRNRLFVKLVANSKIEEINSGDKYLTVYFLGVEIPVWLLFFGLGVSSDREIIDLIDCGNDDAKIQNILFLSIHDADEKCEAFRKGKNALRYIEGYVKGVQFPPSESIEECLSMYVFPNIKGFNRKARFLAYMVKGLLLAYTGRRKCDNRDDFRNKRLELASELLDRELKVHMAHARRRMAKALQRDLYGDRDVRPIEHYLDASIITNGLQRAFSTGAWSHPYKRLERISGVVANLGRTNPLQTMAELRRTRQHVQYTGKVGDARYPHPSHWGKVCFLSTPDGENCGLVKNLAVTGLVSTNISESVLPQLFDCGMEELVDDISTFLGNKDKVFLNGDWVGLCADPISFVADLRSKRRRNELPHQVEIKRDRFQKEVHIYSDAGRILRPLLVLGNLHKIKGSKSEHYSFQFLLDNGVIELVGPEEEEDCCTAWSVQYLFAKEGKSSVKYTHCELDMSFLLGLSCSLVPFANHDHARRVLYQSQKHSSQAIGFSTTNPDIRVDTLSHQLHYPQRPLFRTMTSDCLGKAEFYNGQNAIVAVNVHLGYNQEDSLVMNRASLQRGMFRSEHIRSYKAEIDNKESLEKKRKPEDNVHFGKVQSRIGRVDSLNDDGLPYVGANLQTGDIIIGRCTTSGTDHSIKLKHTERGYVQKVVLSSNDEGKNFAVVSLRQVRSPLLGDKFSSMHGQKGVLGFLESQENFPFTRQGIVPDIVINPHAFPSRQTPGQLLEAALGKGIACGAVLRHATPFSTPSIDDITDKLHRAGFSRWGNERVYNGRTGEMVRSLIFMGPTFYQRLHHMSEDKVKYRNTGPVHPLTRQPVADRKRFGGIKFGEMERDCLIAHGASANLYERLFTLSDSSQIHICSKCKSIANVILRPVSGGHKIRGPYCRSCASVEDIVVASVPYGAKLLCQELFSMGISLKFETELC